METFRLKTDEIYQAPDGRKLIAGVGYGGLYNLYSPDAWNNLDRPEYSVSRDGRILTRHALTEMRVEQLIDTGRSAKYRKLRLL